jgi:alpha-galactosidase
MLGMNLPDNDEWTTAILTSPEVLAVNQDSCGCAGRRFSGTNAPVEIWVKKLEDGATVVGFFNRGNQPLKVDVPWSDLEFRSAPKVRDLWLREDLKKEKRFTAELPPHGSALVKAK